MFGKKLVSDSLLAAVKEVTSGEQIDSSGNELLVGDGVIVHEGPHAGRSGLISGFHNTGRSEVQLDHGPSVALYNETLLNEEDVDGSTPKLSPEDRARGMAALKANRSKNREGIWNHKVGSKPGSKFHPDSKQDEEYVDEDAQSDYYASLDPRSSPHTDRSAMGASIAKTKGGWAIAQRAKRNAELNRQRQAKLQKNEYDYEVDESKMSPAEIIRRRKDQKRELVRGNRKSGKLSDKLYDYELRKSEGKPVNVPKNKQTEEIDPFTGQPIDEKLTDSQRNVRENSRTRTHGGEGMTKTKDDFGQTTTNRGQMSRKSFARRVTRDKKKNGNGNGEKVEINPEIKEAIRKLIHSTLK